MDLKSVKNLASFIDANKDTCPFARIEDVIDTIKGVAIFFKSTVNREDIEMWVDKYISIMKDTEFETDTWFFYHNIWIFRGEISEEIDKGKSFREALDIVSKEYDL